jgi:hypothetical protein
MARYYIESIHFVHIDNFTEGELEQVNSYSLNTFVKADSVHNAIESYIKDYLGYYFDWDNAENSEDSAILDYSELVDSDNTKASESEINKWKLDEITLYSNNYQIQVSEVVRKEIIKP